MSKKVNQSHYRLEHRLVGAVVLVLIAVIVIPLLLKEPDPEIVIKSNAQDEGELVFQSKVEALQAETELQENLQIEQVQRAVDQIDSDSLESVLEPIDEAAQNTQEPKVKLVVESPVKQPLTVEDENPNASSENNDENQTTAPQVDTQDETLWEVRVGTFTKDENAESLKELLAKAGFNAKSTKTTNSLGNVTRVWLGPYANRDTADKIQDRLKALTDQKGFVTERN